VAVHESKSNTEAGRTIGREHAGQDVLDDAIASPSFSRVFPNVRHAASEPTQDSGAAEILASAFPTSPTSMARMRAQRMACSASEVRTAFYGAVSPPFQKRMCR
jgi:hypothetical protein